MESHGADNNWNLGGLGIERRHLNPDQAALERFIIGWFDGPEEVHRQLEPVDMIRFQLGHLVGDAVCEESVLGFNVGPSSPDCVGWRQVWCRRIPVQRGACVVDFNFTGSIFGKGWQIKSNIDSSCVDGRDIISLELVIDRRALPTGTAAIVHLVG